jgi:hypothetical protein
MKGGENMSDTTTNAASALLGGGDSALASTAAKLLFGSNGTVTPGNTPTAWAGASKLLAGPSTNNPYHVVQTGGNGRITGMTFPEARRVDYSRIVAENNAANANANNKYGGDYGNIGDLANQINAYNWASGQGNQYDLSPEQRQKAYELALSTDSLRERTLGINGLLTPEQKSHYLRGNSRASQHGSYGAGGLGR